MMHRMASLLLPYAVLAAIAVWQYQGTKPEAASAGVTRGSRKAPPIC